MLRDVAGKLKFRSYILEVGRSFLSAHSYIRIFSLLYSDSAFLSSDRRPQCLHASVVPFFRNIVARGDAGPNRGVRTKRAYADISENWADLSFISAGKSTETSLGSANGISKITRSPRPGPALSAKMRPL